MAHRFNVAAVRTITCAASALVLAGCATVYSAKPMSAVVVDAETGQPLEGANVVALWALQSPTGRSAGNLEIMEAMTDAEGRFRIAGWSDKPVPSDLPRGTRLNNRDPALRFFKSGYRPLTLDNSETQPNRMRTENELYTRFSSWDGKTIRLERYRGAPEVYLSLVRGMTTGLGAGIPCGWKKTPRLYVALMQEEKRLRTAGVASYLPSMESLENAFRNAGCGSAAEFFRAYGR